VSIAFIDTDVIVRFVTGDDQVKMQAATKLFAAVEAGQQSLICPVTTIADALHVLTSKRLYGYDRHIVATALLALIDLPHFRVTDRLVVRRALEVYAQSRLDFGDTMLIAAMEDADISTLYSYDHHFDRYSWLNRQEP
jgi:predicted nucleic acid-binding protein